MISAGDTPNNYKRFILDPKNYECLNDISSGSFGSVHEIKDKRTGEKLAAKIINLDIRDIKNRQMINREILIMIRCKHPTIINFYGYSYKNFFNQNKITIYMEIAENGSLADVLKKVRQGLADHRYTNTIRQIILIGIAYGMMHLHRNHVIHCDLKPENVLLDSLFHPHLTDFGLSKIYQKNSTMSFSGQFGTIPYMAPELIEDNKHNGKIDVYSFGILMYEVVTDSIPYPLLEKGKIAVHKFSNKVINENYRPEFNVPVKKSIKILIEKWWSKDPKERPTFEEIFKKLAFNIDDDIIDIYEEKEKDEVDDDDDNNKYYLDDVEIDTVIEYADSIQQVNNNSAELDKLLKRIS